MQTFQEVRNFPVSHLFSAAGRPRFMAVFQAFFDGGGDPEDPKVHVFGVAGWIAQEAKWRRLERAWQKICDREGVSALHMRHFAHSLGEFATWKGDEERRGRFLADLVNVIQTNTNRDFSQQMFLDGYRTVDQQFEFHERIGHPFAVCAVLCINAVQEWMAKTHPKDEVMFIFEKGDSYQGDLLDMLRRDKRNLDPNALIFMDKCWETAGGRRCFPPLQCADFLAYEQHKLISDFYVQRKPRKARTSLWALTGSGKHFGLKDRGYSIIDGLFFELLVKGFRLPRRVGVPKAPIPHEIQTMKEIMGDKFHGQPASADLFRIVPKEQPLGTLRKRGR